MNQNLLTTFLLQLLEFQHYIKIKKNNFQCQLLHNELINQYHSPKLTFLFTTTRFFLVLFCFFFWEMVWKVFSKEALKRIKEAGRTGSNLHFHIKCIRRSMAQRSNSPSSPTSSILSTPTISLIDQVVQLSSNYRQLLLPRSHICTNFSYHRFSSVIPVFNNTVSISLTTLY